MLEITSSYSCGSAFRWHCAAQARLAAPAGAGGHKMEDHSWRGSACPVLEGREEGEPSATRSSPSASGGSKQKTPFQCLFPVRSCSLSPLGAQRRRRRRRRRLCAQPAAGCWWRPRCGAARRSHPEPPWLPCCRASLFRQRSACSTVAIFVRVKEQGGLVSCGTFSSSSL